MSREESVQHFLDLIKKSRRGKFKVYIGMIAGVGKTYRMLQEAHDLLDNGVDVNIGYVETHGRAGTEAVLAGLPVIPRRKIFYKGKELEEMDLDAIIRIHPEIVIVDELAHTNVEGSRNEKRWQDVMDLLDEGINVISAVNIQHIESINEEVQGISGIEVKERIPDSVLEEADEVVNIDLTAEELITRLKAGKIYKPDKVALALNNFFKTENILQLRELALKEVALRVEKKVENEVVVSSVGVRHEKFMACISSHEKTPRRIIRKAARLATSLEIYVTGSLNVFNHATDVDLSSRLVCLDLKKLGAGLRTIAMLIMQDLVNSQVSLNFARGIATWCYFDEFHLLLKDPLTASYCVTVWKMLRKKFCVPSALTQNVKDLLASREIENIFGATR